MNLIYWNIYCTINIDMLIILTQEKYFMYNICNIYIIYIHYIKVYYIISRHLLKNIFIICVFPCSLDYIYIEISAESPILGIPCWIPCNGVNMLIILKSLFLVRGRV